MVSSLSDEMMQLLVQHWYDAADQDFNTTERMKLYEDTKQAVTFLKNLSNEQSEATKDKLAKLCNTILQAFDKHGIKESEQLAKWVAHNTSYEPGSEMEFNGAYKPLHHLFSIVAAAKECSDVFNSDPDVNEYKAFLNQLWELASLAYIDSAALNYIELTKKDLSFANDSEALIYSELDLKDLLAIRDSSANCRMMANDELVRRLNKMKISLDDLGIKDDITLATNIIAFFGESCSEIRSLNFGSFADFIDFTFLEHCPNLQSLVLNTCDQITDFSFLKYCPNLQSLDLGYCDQITDFSFLKYCPNLHSLDLAACDQITDFSFLKHCPSLICLDLRGCRQITNFSFLQQYPNLQSLNLSYCNQITDINFLQHCPNLQSLVLSACDQITDFSFLKWQFNLQNLNLAYCKQITDISFLMHCQNLQSLDLSFCPKVTDFSFLENCPNLQRLYTYC